MKIDRTGFRMHLAAFTGVDIPSLPTMSINLPPSCFVFVIITVILPLVDTGGWFAMLWLAGWLVSDDTVGLFGLLWLAGWLVSDDTVGWFVLIWLVGHRVDWYSLIRLVCLRWHGWLVCIVMIGWLICIDLASWSMRLIGLSWLSVVAEWLNGQSNVRICKNMTLQIKKE